VRSDKLELSYRDRLLTYSGDVVVTQGDMIVYLDEERSVVEGGNGRVQALLFPGEDLGALRAGGEATP
jgi:lipopolysaccharide export system protein LptA